MLAVRVAELVGAKKLVIFSSIDGLYRSGEIGGDIIPEVENIDEVIGHAEEVTARMSVGGMQAKLAAVKRAVNSGIETFIANGREPERLEGILAGTGICTRFKPSKKKASAN